MAATFRIKGISYKHAVEYYEANVPGGMAALKAGLSDSSTAFFDQPFTSSGWYDIAPMRDIDVIAARITGQPFDRFVKEIARWTARREFLGVYKLFLKMLRPATIAQWVPRLGAQYYDFGSVSLVESTPKSVVFRMSGMPAEFADWLQWGANEYVRVALELNGCSGIQLNNEALSPDGDKGGVPLVRRDVIVRWE